jgi:hypothetical protein
VFGEVRKISVDGEAMKAREARDTMEKFGERSTG